MKTKIITVNLPEYTIDKEPAYDKLGLVVDRAIEKELPDGRYIIRAISIDEHKGLSVDELIAKILELGTDKYDPKRKPVAYEDFQAYDYDIQAGYFDIKDGKIVDYPDDECRTTFGTTIYEFYVNTPFDRGYPVRIDLLLLYDPEKLELAKIVNNDLPKPRAGLEKFLYKFKNPDNKKEALVGLVKVGR